jgi:hypothetical protein
MPKSRGVFASALSPGDHICVRRRGGLYTHHGVYVGGGNVIHYSDAEGLRHKSAARVVETTLEEFCAGGELRLVPHRHRSDPLESVRRARESLTRGEYSLPRNNCEHFATWCVTGRRKSGQVRRAVATVGVVVAAVGTTLIGRRSRVT